MKTEKQIELLTIESAQKCFAEEESMDKIRLSMEKVESIPELMKDWEEIKTHPILRSGCIIAEKAGEYSYHVLFEINDDGELHIKAVYIRDGVPKMCVEYVVIQDENDPCSVEVREYCDAVMAIWSKQKKSEKMIREYTDKASSDNSFPIGIYLRVMAYINFLLENPQIKQIEQEPGHTDRLGNTEEKKEPEEKNKQEDEPQKEERNQKSQQNEDGELRNAPKKPREIILNGVRIATSDKKTKSSLMSRKRQRIQTFWTVRGHYRHYQSGKTVFIAPYTKGNKTEGKNGGRMRIIKIPDEG